MARIRIIALLLICLGPFSVYADPLIDAVQEGDSSKVKALLAGGANANAKDREGRTALIYAARHGDIAMVEALIARGADVNAKDKIGGGTALIYAALNGHLDVVKKLLEHKADVNALSALGSALTHAAAGCYVDVAEALLARGADVSSRFHRGRTALEIVVQNGCLEIAKLIRGEVRTGKHKLTVVVHPSESQVRVSTAANTPVEYRPGIELERGDYQIQVEQPGYRTEHRRVALVENLRLEISLTPSQQELRKYKLTVMATPPDSKVSFLDRRIPYRPGEALEEGDYYIQVEREGHETQRQWVKLAADTSLPIALAKKRYKLEIVTTPPESRVRVMTAANTPVEYRLGMELETGDYQIQVEQPGYRTEHRRVALVENLSMLISLTPSQQELRTYKLTVMVTPPDSKVSFLDRRIPYQPGQALEEGSYYVQVERDGYETQRQWVNLAADTALPIALAKKRYKLEIVTTPPESRVRVMTAANAPVHYQTGIELETGDYQIQVEQPGYRTEHRRVALVENLSVLISLSRLEEKLRTYKLTVMATPPDSKVSFLDRRIPYQPGQGLEEGSYYVQVEREGYETQRQWVNLAADTALPIALAKKRYKLEIVTTPSESRVRVMTAANAPVHYQTGIELETGDYQIQVEQPGYRTEHRQVALKENLSMLISLSRLEEKLRTYKLTVMVTPPDSKVSFLDRRIPYQPGQALEEGSYHIQVERDGYETQRQWVNLAADTALPVTLAKKRVRLEIVTIPPDSWVRIVNSNTPYQSGMELETGDYQIQVGRNGFITHDRWITLTSDLPLVVKLDEAKAQDDIVVEGKHYALLIGNNKYKYANKLITAEADAIAVQKILKENYGFQTELLLNTTRKDLLDGLNRYRTILKEQDHFLLYYAGHGVYEKVVEKAYWLPIDAMLDSNTEWIISDDIITNIKLLKAKHVLLVADSCFSGTLDRSVTTDFSRDSSTDDRREFLRKILTKTSRTLMASGGNEPVADGGGSGHSIFARALLNALRDVKQKIFTAEELFPYIKRRVILDSQQAPQYKDIRNSGHEDGDFVFIKKR